MAAPSASQHARASPLGDADREGTLGRRWTVMVYMAADNDLEVQARADLAEMKAIGSTPQVALVAQLDVARIGEPTRRFYLVHGRPLQEDAVDPPLGETNTGDARDLARFVAWAMEAYPADRYALVLWNHGIGRGDGEGRVGRWPSQGLGRDRRDASLARALAMGSEGLAGRGAGVWRSRRPVFPVTTESILARGIAWDATSQDFLDNAEIKRALDAALLLSGLDQLDLLGLDACLMQMLEAAYQVRGLARHVVASQEIEPEGGWPYHTVLRRLAAWPEADGAQLGAMVVDAYLRAAAPSEAVTLSVLDLSRIADVLGALNALCRCVLNNVATARPFVVGAARAAQRYGDADYCDLYDLCRVIWDHTADMPLRARAHDLMALLTPAGPDRFIAAEGHRGERVARSHGVSVYFPAGSFSPFYRRLDLSSDSLWDDMLRAVLGG